MTWLGMAPDEWQSAAWTIAIAAMANAACAIVGCYLLLRRQCLLGDAISHAVLPGIALAFLATGSLGALPMFVGALVMGVLTSVFTRALERIGGMPPDVSMGVVFTAMFAAGVLLITRAAPNVHLDPGCVLYGLVEFVSLDMRSYWGIEAPAALLPVGVALAATIAFVLLLWKELKVASFDPDLATTIGISAGVVHYGLMLLVAGVTVASFEAVGSILVVAMLIVPAATAHLLTDRLASMIAWSVAVAVVSAVIGYAVDFWLNTGMAGMIAVAAGGQFLLAALFAPRHGLVARAWRRWSVGVRIRCEDVLARLYRRDESALQPPPVPTAAAAVSERPAGLSVRWAQFRLRRQNLVETAADGRLALTPNGRRAAESVVRAHRLWERYLGAHFDLPLDHLHEAAERLEHFLGPELQARLDRELEHPGVDPHGRPIPRHEE